MNGGKKMGFGQCLEGGVGGQWCVEANQKNS